MLISCMVLMAIVLILSLILLYRLLIRRDMVDSIREEVEANMRNYQALHEEDQDGTELQRTN